MRSTHTTTAESAIWGRLLAPADNTLSAEAARAFLDIDFPEADKDRMRQLADKARRGVLTEDEREEIDSYGRIGTFLSVMKSKARVALRKPRGGNGTRSSAHEA